MFEILKDIVNWLLGKNSKPIVRARHRSKGSKHSSRGKHADKLSRNDPAVMESKRSRTSLYSKGRHQETIEISRPRSPLLLKGRHRKRTTTSKIPRLGMTAVQEGVKSVVDVRKSYAELTQVTDPQEKTLQAKQLLPKFRRSYSDLATLEKEYALIRMTNEYIIDALHRYEKFKSMFLENTEKPFDYDTAATDFHDLNITDPRQLYCIFINKDESGDNALTILLNAIDKMAIKLDELTKEVEELSRQSNQNDDEALNKKNDQLYELTMLFNEIIRGKTIRDEARNIVKDAYGNNKTIGGLYSIYSNNNSPEERFRQKNLAVIETHINFKNSQDGLLKNFSTDDNDRITFTKIAAWHRQNIESPRELTESFNKSQPLRRFGQQALKNIRTQTQQLEVIKTGKDAINTVLVLRPELQSQLGSAISSLKPTRRELTDRVNTAIDQAYVLFRYTAPGTAELRQRNRERIDSFEACRDMHKQLNKMPLSDDARQHIQRFPFITTIRMHEENLIDPVSFAAKLTRENPDGKLEEAKAIIEESVPQHSAQDIIEGKIKDADIIAAATPTPVRRSVTVG